MQLKDLKPNYESVEDIISKANLNESEADAYIRNRKYCEEWLLYSKKGYCSSDSNGDNFIKKLARILNHLESDFVQGNKREIIKKTFSYKNKLFKLEETFDEKTGERICKKVSKRSNIFADTYFELLILSFFAIKELPITLIETRGSGIKIPEFVIELNKTKIAIEAKNVDNESIMDNIFGNSFVKGFDYTPSISDLQKGYKTIKNQIQRNYENAINKYEDLIEDEYYLIFFNIYFDNKFIGKDGIEYLSSINDSWDEKELPKLIGVVFADEKRTIFIENQNYHDLSVINQLHTLGLQEFHLFKP